MRDEHETFSIHFDEKAEPMRSFDSTPYRVYLAGPLTGLSPECKHECDAVRVAMAGLLRSCQAAHFEVYDPAEITAPGSAHTADDVYCMDHLHTMDADLVIFHVNAPSLGVGMEAQIAADATVPKVIVHKKGVPVSRMLDGLFTPTLAHIAYEGIDDLRDQFLGHLNEIAVRTRASAELRNAARSRVVRAKLGREIFKQRIRKAIFISELARQTDIREHWLRQLERSDVRACCLTVLQLLRIANALDCTIAIDKGTPTLHGVDGEDPKDPQAQSLENLVAFVLSETDWKEDRKLFSLWKSGTERMLEGVRGREDLQRVVSTNDWRQLYYGTLF